jgi:diguanylate cyclase (GGDEF)-like protein
MAPPGTATPTTAPARNTRRIVTGLIGGMLVCLWLLVGFWSWWERERTVTTTQQVLEQVGGVVQGQVHALFNQADSMLVVASHWAREHPNQDPVTSPAFRTLIEEIRKSSDGLLDLRVVTRSGQLRYVPDDGMTRQPMVNDRDYVLAQQNPATRGLFIGAPIKSRVTNRWVIPISLPVEGAGGDVALFLVAIDLDSVAAPLETARLKEDGTIAVIRTDGLTMLRAPFNELQLGQSVANHPAWPSRISKTERGNFSADHGLVDAKPRLISFGRTADYPLVVVVTASTDEVLRDWTVHTGVLSVVAAAVSLAFALLGVILLRAMEAEDTVRSELQRLMMTDALTGLGNRRQLNQWLDEEVVRAARYRRPMTAVFFDIDHFKKINDHCGHGVGDRALARVAASLGSTLRKTDRLGRFGGEEFVLVLPETTATDAVPMVERMRRAIGALDIAGLPWKITVSAGIAELTADESVDALLLRADRALYQAKQDGRDRLHLDTATEAMDNGPTHAPPLR